MRNWSDLSQFCNWLQSSAHVHLPGVRIHLHKNPQRSVIKEWFSEFTLAVKKMWTGKSRCVCWCWFSLTYFYPRRYLTQWKLQRDCDQDVHCTPEDEHRQEHENKWSYQHLSGRKHVPYREERQDRQAFRLTHTHTHTHTILLPATLRQLWHQRVLVSHLHYTHTVLPQSFIFRDLTLI